MAAGALAANKVAAQEGENASNVGPLKTEEGEEGKTTANRSAKGGIFSCLAKKKKPQVWTELQQF